MATTSNAANNNKNKSLEEVLDDLCSRFIINLPNEELESFDRLCFQIEAAHWFYLDFFREEMPKLPQVFQHCPLLQPFRGSVDQILANFTQYKVRVPACGAIILNPTLDKGWTNRSSWGFPKGKINKDELESDCAIREVFEETSFDISPYLKPEDHIELVLRETEQRVKLFIIAPIPENTPFFPRTRKEISKISWFPISEFTTDKSTTQLPGTEKKFPLTSPSSIASAAIAPASAINKSKNYFMVIPFINKLRAWVAKRKKHTRKNLHPADNNIITAYDSSTSILPIPTSPIPTPASPIPSSISSISSISSVSSVASVAPPRPPSVPLPYPPPPEPAFVPLAEPISLMHLLTPSKQPPSPSIPHSPSPASSVSTSTAYHTPPHYPTHPSPTPPHRTHTLPTSASSSSSSLLPQTPPQPSRTHHHPPQTVPALPSQSSFSSYSPFSTPTAKTAPSSPYTPYPISPPSSPPRTPDNAKLSLVLSPSDNQRLREKNANKVRNKPIHKKKLNYNSTANTVATFNDGNNPFLTFSFNVDEIMKSFVQL